MQFCFNVGRKGVIWSCYFTENQLSFVLLESWLIATLYVKVAWYTARITIHRNLSLFETFSLIWSIKDAIILFKTSKLATASITSSSRAHNPEMDLETRCRIQVEWHRWSSSKPFGPERLYFSTRLPSVSTHPQQSVFHRRASFFNLCYFSTCYN